jgi:hypothetical protein
LGVVSDGEASTPFQRGAKWGFCKALNGWTTVNGPGIEVQTSGTIGPLAAQHGSYHVEIVQLPTEVPLPATGVLLLAGPGVPGARHLRRSAKS